MNRRTTLLTGAAILVILVAVALSTSSHVLGGPGEQEDPTEQQQTIEAIVNERFTQTAQAQQSFMQTQTAAAGTQQGPTQTAAFQQTLDASFNQALTATAAFDATVEAAFQQALTATLAAQTSDPALAFLLTISDQKAAQIEGWLSNSQQVVIEVMGGEPRLGRFQTLAYDPSNEDQRQALNRILGNAASDRGNFDTFFFYDRDGVILAASDSALITATVTEQPYFSPGLEGPTIQPPYFDVERGEITAIIAVPVEVEGETVGALAGRLNLNRLDTIMTDRAGLGPSGEAYLVSRQGNYLLTPSRFEGYSKNSGYASDGINRALAGEIGAGIYDNYQQPPVSVAGVYRWLPQLEAALLVEVPQAEMAALLLTPTAPPTATQGPAPATRTPRPEVFPTNTFAEVQIAEQVFEHGRMFWISHNRQIWVMVNDPSLPQGGAGDWYCFNDTYEDSEPETDPNLTPPGEGLLQPRRGFGKVWRADPVLQESLGWATTPEFDVTSSYTYIPGGTVDENGRYTPGPGEHRLTTLYSESLSFYEGQVRGDCMGGTWSLTPPE